MKNVKKKDKKSLKEIVGNYIYAFKIIFKCSPGLMITWFITTVSYVTTFDYVESILFLKKIMSVVENGGNFKEFLFCLIWLVLLIVILDVFSNLMDYFIFIFRSKFYKNFNKMLFDKAMKVDMACYDNPEFYDKYTRATEIISDEHADDFVYYIVTILSRGITSVLIIREIIKIEPKLSILLLTLFIVMIFELIKGKLNVKKDKEMTIHKRTKDYSKRTVFLREFSKDMKTSNIFEVMYKKFKEASMKNREIIKKYGIKIGIITICSGFFGESIPVVATYLYSAYKFIYVKDITISEFSVIITAMTKLKSSLNYWVDALSSVNEQAMYFGNLKEFMEYVPTVVSGDMEADHFESIEFKNVTFTYPGAEKPSLKNLSFKINKGDTLAIVGENGAGKSTFVKMLLRFYDPDTGTILYNGEDIRKYDIDSLRNRMATVFQNYKVYALSVAENVLCRECETDEDRENVIRSLKESGAYEKIMSLENKEDTVLTREFDDKGTGLSGGEQQKVATARMFAHDYDIAILDEPSSALDPIAEYNMYESLIDATRDKTVIYISHRLSSAVLSDRVLVFSHGELAESGTHDELMQIENGIYANMFTLQASNYKENEGGEEPYEETE